MQESEVQVDWSEPNLPELPEYILEESDKESDLESDEEYHSDIDELRLQGYLRALC